MAAEPRQDWRHDLPLQTVAVPGAAAALQPDRSQFGADLNRDFGVTFTQDELAGDRPRHNFGTLAPAGREMPGVPVFCRDAGGAIFRSCPCCARDLDMLTGTCNIPDMVPKGRDEAGTRPDCPGPRPGFVTTAAAPIR